MGDKRGYIVHYTYNSEYQCCMPLPEDVISYAFMGHERGYIGNYTYDTYCFMFPWGGFNVICQWKYKLNVLLFSHKQK